jgi:hypothetical protein
VTVYVNGKKVADLAGNTSRHYGHIKISEHAGALRPGENSIAVHARKAKGNRAIDVGLYAVTPPERGNRP